MRLLIIQHIKREGPGLFLQVASDLGMEVTFSHLYLNDPLPKPNKKDVVLIMGGPMGINDLSNPLYPWLKQEVKLINYCLLNQIGLIGICLGAQLLANAAGGTVEILKRGYPPKAIPEIGWGTITASCNPKKEKIFSHLTFPLEVLHWHGDRIILPLQAKLLASSERCREQFFRIGPMAYGLQCHIETDKLMVDQWIKEDIEFIANGLGLMAKDTLKKQEALFSNKSRKSRLKLIFGLMKILTEV